MLMFLNTMFALIALWIAWTDYKLHAIYDVQQLLLLIPVVCRPETKEQIFTMLSGIAVGIGINVIIAFVVYCVYKSEQYGMGDVLLNGCIGGFLGPVAYINYFAITIVLTALITSVYFGIKYHSLNHEYPLAPWLFAGLGLFLIVGQPLIVKF